MTDTSTSPEKKLGSKQLTNKALQEMARPYAVRAIKRLAELVESKNEPVAVSASKTLLAKVLPDLKSADLELGEHAQMLIQVLSGNGHSNNTRSISANASSDRSDAEQSAPLQDAGVAQKS